jgi:cytosine/creatinine deaminase
VTRNAARVFGLQNYGLAAGCDASFVLLQARDPVEAIRLRATRLQVFRKGRRVAHAPAATSTLQLDGRPGSTSFMPPRHG